jgi:hypothetical protein
MRHLAIIAGLAGSLIATSANACPFMYDVEERYRVVPQAQINDEQCKAYVGDGHLEIDIDCPSEREILTIWLDQKTGMQFIQAKDYVSRLRCVGEWKTTDTVEKERALFDARLVANYGSDGHGGNEDGHAPECNIADPGRPLKKGEILCE